MMGIPLVSVDTGVRAHGTESERSCCYHARLLCVCAYVHKQAARS